VEATSGRCKACSCEYDRAWRKANPDKKRDTAARWRSQNPEKARETVRKWRKAHPEQHRENSNQWNRDNPELHRKYNRDYNRANPDKIASIGRKWSQANPEKVKEKRHRRRAKKNGCVVAKADIQQIIEKSGGLCGICRTFVPEEFRHIDHIIPLDKGGPHSQDNLQLLCYRCNQSKGAKMPQDVVQEKWVTKSDPHQPFLLNPDWKR
jgi:5-methylcytosine-specific restriction endonuclease McrA